MSDLESANRPDALANGLDRKLAELDGLVQSVNEAFAYIYDLHGDSIVMNAEVGRVGGLGSSSRLRLTVSVDERVARFGKPEWKVARSRLDRDRLKVAMNKLPGGRMRTPR